MKYAIQWVRSLLFNAQMYVALFIVGIVFFIPALISRRGAIAACRSYGKWVMWTAGWMVGVKCVIRGTPPTDEVVIAAKHQSFLDVLMIYSALPRGKFIMKRLLMYAPVVGQYGLRIGCIPVDRGKRAQAVKKMVVDVAAGRAMAGQLIIYPQGTRIAPGVKAKYKVGAAILYTELNQDCIPVAVNVGLFWPKRGIYRTPGTAVIEFLPRIPKGMEVSAFTTKLEDVIETRSNELMREAGFTDFEE